MTREYLNFVIKEFSRKNLSAYDLICIHNYIFKTLLAERKQILHDYFPQIYLLHIILIYLIGKVDSRCFLLYCTIFQITSLFMAKILQQIYFKLGQLPKSIRPTGFRLLQGWFMQALVFLTA